jgi:hypothetical protein
MPGPAHAPPAATPAAQPPTTSLTAPPPQMPAEGCWRRLVCGRHRLRRCRRPRMQRRKLFWMRLACGRHRLRRRRRPLLPRRSLLRRGGVPHGGDRCRGPR